MHNPFKFALYKPGKRLYLPSWKILKLRDFLKSVTDVQILCKKSLFHTRTTDHIHNLSYATLILRRNKNYIRMDTMYIYTHADSLFYMWCAVNLSKLVRSGKPGYAERKGRKKGNKEEKKIIKISCCTPKYCSSH